MPGGTGATESLCTGSQRHVGCMWSEHRGVQDGPRCQGAVVPWELEGEQLRWDTGASCREQQLEMLLGADVSARPHLVLSTGWW